MADSSSTLTRADWFAGHRYPGLPWPTCRNSGDANGGDRARVQTQKARQFHTKGFMYNFRVGRLTNLRHYSE